MFGIHGWTARGFAGVREPSPPTLEHHGSRCGVLRYARSAGGRSLGRVRRHCGRQAVGRGHRADRLLGHQGRHRGLRQSARRARRARPRCADRAYWPEFAAAGKGAIPVRWALSHQAGLAAVDGELTLAEVLAWDPVVAAIAAQAPNWEPGTAHGYHARSYGWILGEVVRRVTGTRSAASSPTRSRRRSASTSGSGCPPAELPRCARIIPPERLVAVARRPPRRRLAHGAGDERARPASSPTTRCGTGPRYCAAEMPSSNGVGSARALARFYAALRRRGRRHRRARARDRRAPRRRAGRGARPRAAAAVALRARLHAAADAGARRAAGTRFGHPGAGGSLGFADPRGRHRRSAT